MPSAASAASRQVLLSLRWIVARGTHESGGKQHEPSGSGPFSHAPPRAIGRVHSQRSPAFVGRHSARSEQRPAAWVRSDTGLLATTLEVILRKDECVSRVPGHAHPPNAWTNRT